MTPSAQAQLQFIAHLQRLFEDGDFVATYKYALLMALAEIAVENVSEDDPLSIRMEAIGEKFAELYWSQTVPYASGSPGSMPMILAQNHGKQAAVINDLLRLRSLGAQTIAEARRRSEWQEIVRNIARTVAGMPIQYLQNIGGILIPFLYDLPLAQTGTITLKPGVSHMLRTFHPLIQQLARTGWMNHVRKNRRNGLALGRMDDLEQFMFGTPRAILGSATSLLSRIQSQRCFYCGEALRGVAEVDHFVPWIKYPRDLAHNFVLAHAVCNRRKSDRLAAQSHLERWVDRNATFGEEIAEVLQDFVADVECSRRVAFWAYEQAIASGGYGWVHGRQSERLLAHCLAVLN